VTVETREDGVGATEDDMPVGESRPSTRFGRLSLRRGLRRRERRNGLRRVPWGFAVPAVIAVLLLRYASTILGGVYSFTDWNGLGLYPHWVGFRNFENILKDAATRSALWHTLELAAMFVVIVNLTGLGLALGLRRTLKTRNLLRAVFFLPAVLSELATAYIWQYIFQYDGPLNTLLGWVGLDSWKKAWTADPTWALYTILFVLIWQLSGLTMVIYLAGLQSIPEELDDAAAIDGASTWGRFRRITLPLLAPAITVSVTLTLIFGLRVFDQVIALTNGGPVFNTETLATQVYKETFVFSHFGYGAAIAVILTVLVAVATVLQTAFFRAREARL
jgi:raffinose/stachyose/melibiose transport system permease protein